MKSRRQPEGAAVALADRPATPAPCEDGTDLTTVFRADGSIMLQSPASAARFATRNGGAEDNAFLSHFADSAEAVALMQRVLAGETIEGMWAVHTAAGIERLAGVLTPLGHAASGEHCFSLVESKAAPVASIESEQRLRDYAEAAADWFWEMDAGLRFVAMSESTQLPASQATGTLVGRRLVDVAAASEFGDWRAVADLLEARLPFRDVRFRWRDDNGVVYHLSVSGLPVFEPGGRFAGYRGIGRDLTLLVRAEQYAAVAQSRLVAAIESIPECFMLLDAEDRLVLCNSRYREVNAAVAPWLVGGTPLADIYRASAEQGAVRPAATSLEERFQPGAPSVGESRIGDRWFQISQKRTEDGGSVVIQTEITALKRREHELAEKTALLRATLDNMQQGLIVLDGNLRMRIWNDKIADIFDLPQEVHEVGRSIVQPMLLIAERGSLGPGDPAQLVAVRVQQMRDATSIIDELDLGDRIVERRLTRMPDSGLLLTYLDITDRKRVEGDLRRAKEEAELASRTKTEFLANMSHELRTPLNAIIGFAEILSGQVYGPLGDQRYAEYATDIRDSGQHLLNLINDLLDVSKIEFNKVELSEEVMDLAGTIDACARLMRDRADQAGLELVARTPPTLPLLNADARRLKQILLNLMSNAVKFTPPGGRVTVSASEDAEGGIRIAVADTGIGIAAHDLEKALRPFGQIDSRMARKYQGSGLGLPLTKSMIELHGGTLTLDSTPGKGTTATLWLPPWRTVRRRCTGNEQG